MIRNLCMKSMDGLYFSNVLIHCFSESSACGLFAYTHIYAQLLIAVTNVLATVNNKDYWNVATYWYFHFEWTILLIFTCYKTNYYTINYTTLFNNHLFHLAFLSPIWKHILISENFFGLLIIKTCFWLSCATRQCGDITQRLFVVHPVAFWWGGCSLCLSGPVIGPCGNVLHRACAKLLPPPNCCVATSTVASECTQNVSLCYWKK